jgi:glycosyltransferase involved in cell wall biosynthesis
VALGPESQRFAREDPKEPFVSVIVPVYNDAARLARCLLALESQTYPPGRYEVIVVDNGSDVSVTPSLGEFPHTQFEREPRPGDNAARIAGVLWARGEMLAFTDADCLPEPGWIAGGVSCFLQTPNCGLVGGRIVVFVEDMGRRPGVAATLSAATHLKQERFVEHGRWATFANLFTSRQVIDHVGWINPALLTCGENEWCRRVDLAGYSMAYASGAVVRHPARASVRQLCRRAVRFEFAWRQIRGITGLRRSVRSWVGQYLVWPVRDMYRDVIRHPHLTRIQKTQAVALACLLIVWRLSVALLMQSGIRFDPRKKWG